MSMPALPSNCLQELRSTLPSIANHRAAGDLVHSPDPSHNALLELCFALSRPKTRLKVSSRAKACRWAVQGAFSVTPVWCSRTVPLDPIIDTTDDGADRYDDDREQLMQLRPVNAGIFQARTVLAHRSSRLVDSSFMATLLTTQGWSLAPPVSTIKTNCTLFVSLTLLDCTDVLSRHSTCMYRRRKSG